MIVSKRCWSSGGVEMLGSRCGLATVVALLAVSLAVVGCSTDPVVRKQRYVESGDRYADQEKWREAVIDIGMRCRLIPSLPMRA